MSEFETFMLAAAERAPFLLGETTVPLSQQPQQPQRKRPRDNDEVLSAGGAKKQQTREEIISRLQRMLVDGPLQPLGAEHALYHVLLPAFLAAMQAARSVWEAKQALQTSGEAGLAREEGKGDSSGSGDASALSAAAAAGGETGTQQRPSAEALQRAVSSAQTTLSARRRDLDAAEAKVRLLVRSMTQYVDSVTERRGEVDG
ncbi:hypothetical protein DQ04_07811020 [Trypanosoma grayi]|uniref:hypothetical protein n=1 Tax=Trypanosoma grayi TaxID=71804 RepID=UPI0004F436CF|nr:hypothetical protein DQ04_07811020 [Trypanosoma grayi]KEG08182.1 hypothetical protein DQ04_07811020 [Trypanosoma grayi]